jgi:hypothetical protein
VHLDFPTAQIVDSGYVRALMREVMLKRRGAHPPHPLPNFAFRLTTRNCDPVLAETFFDVAPPQPYDAPTVDATMFRGSGSLSASFKTDITDAGAGADHVEQILAHVNDFAVVPCANPVVPSPFVSSSEPLYQEAGSLVAPFFFKDMAAASNPNELTFFVQPTLTEKTVVEWPGWAIVPYYPGFIWKDPGIIDHIIVIPQVPIPRKPPLGDPIYSVIPIENMRDWVTDPATTILFGETPIAEHGSIDPRASKDSIDLIGIGKVAGQVSIGSGGLTAGHLGMLGRETFAVGPGL